MVAAVPMLRRYSRCKGDTLRNTAYVMSGGRLVPGLFAGTNFDGTNSMSGIKRSQVLRYMARACIGRSEAG